MKLAPDRKKFMEVISGNGNVEADIEKFCTNFSPLLQEIHKFLVRFTKFLEIWLKLSNLIQLVELTEVSEASADLKLSFRLNLQVYLTSYFFLLNFSCHLLRNSRLRYILMSQHGIFNMPLTIDFTLSNAIFILF